MVKWFRYESDDPEADEPEIDPFEGMAEEELRSQLLEKVIAHLNVWNGNITYNKYDSTPYFGEYGVYACGRGYAYIKKYNSKSYPFSGVDAARLDEAERKCYERHEKRKNLATLKALLK